MKAFRQAALALVLNENHGIRRMAFNGLAGGKPRRRAPKLFLVQASSQPSPSCLPQMFHCAALSSAHCFYRSRGPGTTAQVFNLLNTALAYSRSHRMTIVIVHCIALYSVTPSKSSRKGFSVRHRGESAVRIVLERQDNPLMEREALHCDQVFFLLAWRNPS